MEKGNFGIVFDLRSLTLIIELKAKLTILMLVSKDRAMQGLGRKM